MVISRTRLAMAKTMFWFVVSWTACGMLAYRLLRSDELDWSEEFITIGSGITIGLISAAFELFAVPIDDSRVQFELTRYLSDATGPA